MRNRHKGTPQGHQVPYNTLIHKRQMPDDLQKEEELLFKALEEYKEKKSQEPIVKPQDDTSNILPAVIAAVL